MNQLIVSFVIYLISVFMLEINKIYNEDCLEGMKKIDDNSVDLVVTSPPYDKIRTYDGIVDTWSFDKFKKIAIELTRVLKDGGVLVWVVGDATINGSETCSSFKQVLYFKEECGLKLHDTMIYIKNGGINRGSLLAYQQKFEYMFVFVKGKIGCVNLIKDRKNKYVEDRIKRVRQSDGTFKEQHFKSSEFGVRYNYWIYDTGNHKDEKFVHPAQFPTALAIDHIKSWSNPNELVLDPFMGSGTTAIACIRENRNFIGFELNKDYYDKSCKRIKEELQEKEFSLF